MSGIDTAVLQALYSIRDAGAVQIFIGITEFGSTLVIGGIALSIGLWLLLRALLAHFAGLCVSVVGTIVVVFPLKEFAARTRPDVFFRAFSEDTFSFPSGHAAFSLALYGFLMYLAWKHLPHERAIVVSVGLAILVILIGFSRLYLGLHFFSDVVAGYAIGGIFLALGIWVAESLTRRPILS